MARPALYNAQVSVTSAPPSDLTPPEYLMFTGGDERQTFTAQGLERKQHAITIEGVILVSLDGGDEPTARRALSRAFEILYEVESEVRGTLAGSEIHDDEGTKTAIVSMVGRIQFRQGATLTKRVATIRFELTAEAETTKGLPDA